jgi:hypothetical protein
VHKFSQQVKALAFRNCESKFPVPWVRGTMNCGTSPEEVSIAGRSPKLDVVQIGELLKPYGAITNDYEPRSKICSVSLIVLSPRYSGVQEPRSMIENIIIFFISVC